MWRHRWPLPSFRRRPSAGASLNRRKQRFRSGPTSGGKLQGRVGAQSSWCGNDAPQAPATYSPAPMPCESSVNTGGRAAARTLTLTPTLNTCFCRLEQRDFYADLGVPKGADESSIKSAFRKKAKTCHPDVAPDKTSEWEKVNAAAQIIGSSSPACASILSPTTSHHHLSPTTA